MLTPTQQRYLRLFVYGAGSVLLLLDIFLLFRAVLTDNFVPIVPILTGIFTAIGLILIIWAEGRARVEDQRDHLRISRVAHQLQSPLKALRDDLESLLKEADSIPGHSRLKLKRMATKSSVVLENIHDLFLTLEAQSGSIARDVRVWDLCAQVTEAVARAKPLASARNVELITTQHCSHAPVRVDRRLLLVALSHLLENAIVYTRTPGLVNIAVVRGQRAVRVVIQDRGIGISAADAPLVERPFARGSEAEKYDPDGIGLGIALTKLIVKQSGGQLVWRSHPKRLGSEFEIQLPLYNAS
ncbi:MAG TPA: HAMP domain-containing sensor histidine kinase [Candidatus Andersenbacteria bacterium]|nr:HAMP domain-containing sensor histidine kinase [Candidatus Andersenbacteria bacterium]